MKKSQAVLCGVLTLVLIITGLPSGRVRAAGIIYVKADASGSNNGSSWADAFTNLQNALTFAVSGDEIWVAAGAYQPTNTADRTFSFKLKDGVALYGGFAGTETLRTERNWTTNVTILSGEIGTPDNIDDNTFHIVDAVSVNGAVLDGFTIMAGNAFGATTRHGGGIYINVSNNLSLTNLILKNNQASQGGAIYNLGSIGLTITSVTFRDNVADYGGGFHNTNSHSSLSDVTFSNNRAHSAGGGMKNFAYDSQSNPTLTNVVFRENHASQGGGMENNGGASDSYDGVEASPILTNVVFSKNHANLAGGGMSNYRVGRPKLTNVTFSNNSTDHFGGGMESGGNSAPELTNVTFDSNSALFGGAIFSKYSNYILKNVTFRNNDASRKGGWLYAIHSTMSIANITTTGNHSIEDNCGMNSDITTTNIENSILWGNGIEVCERDGTVGIQNSTVQGGCLSSIEVCDNIINVNPRLQALASNGGFTKTMALGADSPAIDKGYSPTCTATDQRGVARPQGPSCDMGAYEKDQVSLTFNAQAANDGWILESAKGSGTGGTANATSTTLPVGDNNADRQYRVILSFNTTSPALPIGAVMTGARLKLKAQGVSATNPLTTLGNLLIDISKGRFGENIALELGDFKATASQDNIGSIASVPPSMVYSKVWSKSITSYINTSGITQFRLRFATTTDNNLTANTINFFSGNASVGDRPQLIVYYYMP